MVQTDPLFAAEGMNLEGAEAALDGLAEVARAYEAVLGKHPLRRIFFTVMPIARSAIPIPFLRSFVECERRRRIFLARPTMSSARRLVESWETAQKHYARSVNRLTSLYRVLQAFDRVTKALSPEEDKHGNILTRDDIDRQLGSLKANARALANAMKVKRDCLRGIEEALPRSNPDSHLRYIEGSVPERYARMHEFEILHGAPFRHGAILEEHGPILYTLSNFDGTPTAHNFKLYIVRDDKSGAVSLKVTVLDVYLFLKLNMKPEVLRLRNHQSLAGTGLPYWYQAATKLYATRDQAYWADIATIVDMRRRPHLDRNLVHAQKSSMFDLLLGSCLGEHGQGLESIREHVLRGTYASSRAWKYLLHRAYPGIYFLTFNKSVWRLEERPDFLGSRRAGPEEFVYKSADEILAILTPDELELVMQGGRTRERVRRESGYGLEV